jgi:hypothetical protein
MDFLFWGHILDSVHSERVESLSDLRRRITATVAAVPVDLLFQVWGKVEFGFVDCRAVNGAHIKFR